PFAEVEGPAVDRADLGQQLFDVGETVEGVDEVGARHRRQGVLRVDDEVTAHAGGEVDDRVDIGCADPTDDLTVVGDLACALLGLEVTHVDVDDGGSGTGGGDRIVRDLLRGDGHVLALAGGV